MPFKMVGGECVDDTPVHKAIREALANCLINADYHGVRGVVIRKEEEKIIFANPGYVRTGKKQMRLGGESAPRNKSLMKMFNLINIGERAGVEFRKKRRKKELLRALIRGGKLIDDGATKGKRYKKAD